MDLYCTRCGEPWELDDVLHDAEDGEFRRSGGRILRPARRTSAAASPRRTGGAAR